MAEHSTNFKTIQRLILLDRLLQQRRGYTNQQIASVYRQQFDIGTQRTVMNDISRIKKYFLEDEKQLEKFNRSFHRYREPGFSIFGNPITQADSRVLKEIQILLRKQTNFELSEKLTEILQKLNKRLYNVDAEKTDIVVFEQVPDLSGAEHLETLFKALTQKKVLKIKYCAFDADREKNLEVHPLQLRQNKNRWLLIGMNGASYKPEFLGVDRILECAVTDTKYRKLPFDINQYFEEMIGISKPEKDEVLEIKLLFTPLQAKYVFSKPIHQSLTKEKTTPKGVYAALSVKPNYELYQWLLGMGNAVKVLSPSYVIEKLAKKQTPFL